MKKYYYLNACATPCAKVYAEDEPLVELPKHWREISAEEYKEFITRDWDSANED
jgi:hypothetical protein